MSDIFNNAEDYRIGVITEVAVPIQRSSFVFHQRVYSTSQGWCYYSTMTETDPQPLASATVPQHANDISEHQLIAITALVDEET